VSLWRGQYGVTLAAAVACVLEGTMTPLPPTLITGYKEVDLALESVPDEAALRQRAESTSGYEQRARNPACPGYP
jgi:hypothetical protein